MPQRLSRHLSRSTEYLKVDDASVFGTDTLPPCRDPQTPPVAMRGGLKTVLLMATIAILANRLWMLGVIDLSPATLGESLKQFALKDIHPQIDILVAKVQDLIGGDGGACGWVGTSKFAIVSSRVVTPAGEMPAAGLSS